MNWVDLNKKISIWRPAVFLERTVGHSTRRVLKQTFLLIAVLSFAFASGIFIEPNSALTGLFFIFFFAFLLAVLAESFFYSFFFRESESSSFGFETAIFVSYTDRDDLTKGFFSSKYAESILLRLGIDKDSAKHFLDRRQRKISPAQAVFPDSASILESYLLGIVSADKEFEAFLFLHGASPEIFVRCSKWVIGSLRRKIDKERWWSKKRLSSIKPIGGSWSYGKTYFLERFSTPLRVAVSPESSYHREEAISLETILSKGRESNALIVGDEGVGKMEVIETLVQKIRNGKSSKFLESKNFIVFEAVNFVSAMGEKEIFERAFIKLMNEASSAGNVVLIIPDFSGFLKNAESIGSDVSEIIDPYLSSSGLQVVAVSNTRAFHSVLEANQAIMQRFDTVLVKEGAEAEIFSTLEEGISFMERREGAFFTYQAIAEALSGAERYFVGSPILDTALDILSQSTARAFSQGRNLVLKEDVLSIIKSETGVPVGEVSEAEQEKLAKLEEHLRQRIVGQDEAITTISNALRRSRAGIGNPNKPIGSFLFLGPTGVGKTETAKALTEIFFGQKGKMMRLDMSEYNSPDALNRLIGFAGTGDGGVLGSMLRENPYAVLLLDEFEKTNEKVLDLFLQILDEGIFSDVLGRKVSARNTIIIATSNAGSDIIFESVMAGDNLEDKKDFIIEEIIKRGVYKPELLNRFDGITLFHPLNENELKEVAGLMLERLAFRLKAQGITLNPTEDLIQFLVSKGGDPKFGARALNREIQETVEKVIADKILRGELRPGSELYLSSSDLI